MFRIPSAPVALVTAFFVSLSAGVAAAPAQSSDEKELAAYRLTLPTVKKVAAATIAMAEEGAKDPRAKEMQKIKSELEELQKKEELTEAEQAKIDKLEERKAALEDELERSDIGGDSNAQSLADMEARLKKHPAAMRALSAQGLTPREYAVCMMALLQAAMAEGFSQGKLDLNKLPPGINPENIKFVRENKAELEAMQKAMAGKSR
jgi:septal ring factor EnvC (AmiA/AmiB activator)